MQLPEPQKEHRWLHQLVGDWTYVNECSMGPDQPPMKTEGTESVCLLGELWTIGESVSKGPDGGEFRSIMTLGFDPVSNRFCGHIHCIRDDSLMALQRNVGSHGEDTNA